MASPGRVLFIVENLPVPFDRRVWSEATTLRDAGYTVSVVCPKGRYARAFETVEGIHVYRYPLPSLGGIVGHFAEYAMALGATFGLTMLVWARHGFDVVHVANPPDLFFPLAWVVRRWGKRFVFDHHDLVPETCLTRYRGVTGWLIHRFSLWCERRTFRAADLVVSTNESYRTVALERGGKAPDQVVVVRSGPRSNRFMPVPPNPALRNGRSYLVCYLGVMGPNDGLDELVDTIAATVLKFGRRDVHFALIGDGDVRPRIEARIRSEGLVEFATLTGRIPDAEVIEYLCTADACVAPDPKDLLNDVSTMNKIVEYMALGRPIVAFDLREARVSAGDAAVYAQPNDPVDLARRLIEVLDRPDRREKMSNAGRARFLSVLSWEHQAEHLRSAYAGLLGKAS